MVPKEDGWIGQHVVVAGVIMAAGGFVKGSAASSTIPHHHNICALADLAPV